MEEKQFSKAVFEMIKQNPENASSILKKAKDYLLKNGDKKLLNDVERSLRRLMLAYEKAHTVTVTTSEKITKEKAVTVVKKYKDVFPNAAKIETKEDETIIGGEIIEDSRMRIDNSYKRALKNIYQNIVTSL